MIKISIEIAPMSLQMVCEALTPSQNRRLAKDPSKRAQELLLLEVYEKLLQLYYDKVSRFNYVSGKPIKTSLKYYHGYVLLCALRAMRSDDKTEQAIMNKVVLQLDQKLQ